MYKVLRDLVLEYIGDEEWIYRNFGILTPYLYSINYRPKQKDYKNKLSLIENVMYNQLGNLLYDNLFYNPKVLEFETLQNIAISYNKIWECLTDDDIQNHQTIYKFIDEVTNNEMAFGEPHPYHFPIGYLTTGILYNENWEYLTDKDINKFCISYGIPLILDREIKIVKIVENQNIIFEGLVQKGYDDMVRGCPRTTKLIQKIEDNIISIDEYDE